MPLWAFINLSSKWINNPNYYACYYINWLYYLVSAVFMLVTFAICMLCVHYGYWQSLLIESSAENQFEFYRYLIDYSAIPSLLFLLCSLLWLRKHFGFKEYNYTRPKPIPELEAKTKRFQFPVKYESLFVLLCFIPIIIFFMIPSLFGTFFYKDKWGGYFISQLNNPIFIFIGGLFISYCQILVFQLSLIGSTYLLSARHQLRNKGN